MKIGILSDTHNHADNTRRALEVFREHGVKKLIHCGDLTTPEIVFLFAGWDVTFVLGNMDLDRSALAAAAQAIGAKAPQLSQEIQVDGTLIGATHGAIANVLQGMMMSGKYAYVCHGHTHERRDEFRRPYGVRLINPGSLGGNHPQPRSVCILDLDTGAVEFVEFPEMG